LVSARHIDQGATLISEGDEVDTTYTVLRGMLRVVRYLPDGRRHILEFLVPGDTFDFEPERRYSSTVEAVVASDLCSIRHTSLESLGLRFPALKDRLFATSCRKLQRAYEAELTLARRTPSEKVAAFLVALAERARHLGEPEAVIRLPMTRSDIADHLGLTIETVSRTFTLLRKDGIIRLPASHLVEVRKPHELAALAGLK